MAGQNQIPVTVVGGYLGSGKTTLLSHMIAQHDMSDCVFLINDFGALAIDAELVSAQGGNTVELANGCICCSMADGLSVELLKIIRSKRDIQRIVIEASGIADPGKIADLADLSRSLRLDQVIVLVDADRIRKSFNDPLIREMVAAQLEAADILVLNKIDQVRDIESGGLITWLEKKAPQASLVSAVFADVPGSIIFKQVETGPDQHENRIDTGRSEAHSEFESWCFTSSKSFERQLLIEVLDSLPDTVLRIKGFVSLFDSPDAIFVLQMVQGAWSLSQSELDMPVKSGNQLNVVGSKQFSSDGLERRLNAALNS